MLERIYFCINTKGEKMKKKKYKVWTHYDTGIMQTIEAESELEALAIAEERLEQDEFTDQLLLSMERGKTEIVREEDLL
jgi:hypothetical protein